MRVLYDILFLFGFVLSTPALLFKRKFHRGYRERFGGIELAKQSRLKEKGNLWVHAVSVGEVLAIVDIIKRIKKIYPQYRIVLTTVTKTGYALAHQHLQAGELILYAPLDLSWVVNKFIRLIRPKIYIVAETEIWPNLYRSLKNARVPICQVNGRISDRSFIRYSRFKSYFKKTLDCVELFCMQSQTDGDRIVAMGAPKEKVYITGNIKFDNLPQEAGAKYNALGYGEKGQVLIAGSTHPKEEEIILGIYEKLRNEGFPLALVISPRHVERALEVKQLVEAKGFKPVLFTELNGKAVNDGEVLVIDQIGVLKELYSIATIVFIGKTLSVGGGQNMIEPAFFGKPTLVGPLTYNFKDIMRIFLSEKALIQVQTPEELLTEMSSLLRNGQRRKMIGDNARNLVRKYQGASSKTVELIGEFLRS